MKTYGDVDLLISRWLEASAPTREPEHLLGDVLQGVERSGRRPAWRIPERWFPMDTAARFRTVPRAAPLFVALLLLLLAALAMYVVVGGRPKTLLPTGPAANGQIAYTSDGQLWLAGPDGSNPRAITSDALVIGVPHWSRDGTKVAYLRFEADPGAGDVHGDGRATLVVADADGRHPVTIIDGVKWTRYVDMSPDATRIAYSYFADDATTYQHDRIEIAPTDGSARPIRIGNPDLGAFYPAFSPDGARIAFLSDHYPDLCDQGDCNGEKSFGLHVMKADGTAVRVLAHGATQPLLAPAVDRWAPIVDWSHDGTQILFTGVEAVSGAIAGLYVVDADAGSLPQRIDTGGSMAYGGSYSPTGDQIAFVRAAGQGWEAVVADADGSPARVIASGISRFAPQWSPDGRSIAVIDPIKASTATGPTATVRIIPVDGQGPVRTIQLALHTPADDALAPTVAGIDQISWQRLAP